MAITLNANFEKAINDATVHLVYLVEIELPTGGIFKFTDADRPLFGYPSCVTGVTPSSLKLDPFSRKLEIGEVSVTFNRNEGSIRDLIRDNYVHSSKVTTRVGTVDLVEGDFQVEFVGYVESIDPQKDIVTLRCLDLFKVAGTATITGGWLSRHPLQILQSIIEKSGISTSKIDLTSFDPDNAAYDTISHWVISRGTTGGNQTVAPGTTGIWEPVPALPLMEDLLTILNGTLFVDTTGKIKFSRFDATDAAVDDFALSDQLDGSFEQKSGDENIVNAVTVSFFRAGQEPDSRGEDAENHRPGTAQSFSWTDADSITNYALPGESLRVIDKTIKTNWIMAWGSSFSTAGDPIPGGYNDSQTSIVLGNGTIHGFAGTRDLLSDGTPQPANAKLSATRKGYFQAANGEFFEATVPFAGTSFLRRYPIDDPNDPYTDAQAQFVYYTFGVSSRGGVFGTTAKAGGRATLFVDYTIPVAMAQERIERFSNGVPIITTSTGYKKMGVEIGDLVTGDFPGYLVRGRSGTDSTVKWEVIGKEPDPHSNPPRIKWTLALAFDSVFAATNPAIDLTKHNRGGLAYGIGLALQGADAYLIKGHLVEGLLGSQTGSPPSLTAQISAGTCSNQFATFRLEEPFAFNVTASKDTYVYIDLISGVIVTRETTLGAGAPGDVWGLLRISKFVTDATTITSVDNTTLVNTTDIITGGNIIVGTVDSLQLATAAVTEPKLGDASVSTVKFVEEAVTPYTISQPANPVLLNSFFTSFSLG